MSTDSNDSEPGEPFVTPQGAGRAVWSVNALVVIQIATDAVALMDYRTPPGYETPLHTHREEDEFFHVLAGELECVGGRDGSMRMRAGEGDSVFVPRGVAHGLRAVGDDPLRTLVGVTPGGFEEFFVAAGEPAEAMEPPPQADLDGPALAELGAEYGMEIHGPLPE